MTPTSTAADINQAQAYGAQNQSVLNNQALNAQGTYGNATNQANSAYGNLQNLTQNLPQNYLNYTGQIAQANGYNPQTLQNSMNNATTLSETMAGLPNAVNQMGNYSGATAGQIAQNYGNLAPGIATAQAGNNTALANQQAAYAAGQTGANNITGEQMTGATAAAANAQQIMATASTTMTNIENLAQQQGYLTSEQVANYQNAYNNLVSANAASTSAGAAATTANQAVTQYQNIEAGLKSLYGNNWQQAIGYITNGQAVPSSVSGTSGSSNSGGINIGGGGGLQTAAGGLQ